ncbi:MAG: class II fructose-1,6-bisphosphate aldolase [Candidatus Eisenbacteria bacterium]|nr:class II fructose-1,6-bisphosphate aldolase [Candidatus Eisenbacteria bacterium]
MSLVTNSALMVPARESGYAVGAFNTSNLEITQAVFEAAVEQRSPVIIATSQSAIKYAGYSNIVSMVANLARETDVPASLHLDHGTDLEVIQACIEHGWTSVMIDGSHHPLEENIAVTRQVVEMARPKEVSVEAELGRLMGVEDEIEVSEGEAVYTDPEEAERFVSETGCDALAVAIGTSHGAYKFKGEAKLAVDRLRAIADRVEIPLVLHGASAVPQDVLELARRYGADLPGARGVPAESIKEAVGHGIAKINIDTDLRLAFTARVREFLAEQPEVFDPRKILAAARAGMKDVVTTKMKLFGSAGTLENRPGA